MCHYNDVGPQLTSQKETVELSEQYRSSRSEGKIYETNDRKYEIADESDRQKKYK